MSDVAIAHLLFTGIICILFLRGEFKQQSSAHQRRECDPVEQDDQAPAVREALHQEEDVMQHLYPLYEFPEEKYEDSSLASAHHDFERGREQFKEFETDRSREALEEAYDSFRRACFKVPSELRYAETLFKTTLMINEMDLIHEAFAFLRRATEHMRDSWEYLYLEGLYFKKRARVEHCQLCITQAYKAADAAVDAAGEDLTRRDAACRLHSDLKGYLH